MDKYYFKDYVLFAIIIISLQTQMFAQKNIDIVSFSYLLSQSNYLQKYLEQTDDQSEIIYFYGGYFHLDWYTQSKSDSDSVDVFVNKLMRKGKIVFGGASLFMIPKYDQFFILDELVVGKNRFKCKMRAFSFSRALDDANSNINFGIFTIKGVVKNKQWGITTFKEKKYNYHHIKDFDKFNDKYWFGCSFEDGQKRQIMLEETGRIIK